MTIDDTVAQRITRTMKGTLIAVSIIGIILGILALVWPGATLLTVAILFGSYLIAAGVFRVSAAITADSLSAGVRWLLGILGVLIIVAGIISLANPFRSLIVLAFVIGIGWILDGIVDIGAGAAGTTRGPRWLAVVSGVVSIIAGIVIFLLPGLAIATFILFGAILLIVVSATTLLTLPFRGKNAAAV
ncbi:MAG: DUF308 domain-containing protein [Cryobacterium sp.]|nr:DUF308 domain-containing protein [Cryobacterium sp.]MBX3310048.1 DUF308 domain-containing protein [Cryobacterium sp.]